MDFRACDIAGDICWNAPASKVSVRGKASQRTVAKKTTMALADALTVQTPWMELTSLGTHRAGAFKLSFKVVPAGGARQAFVEWVCDLERSAVEAAGEHAEGRRLMPTFTFFGGLEPGASLLAFSNALFFNAAGQPADMAECVAANQAALILELGGAWFTEDLCGLTWTVRQVKMRPEPLAAKSSSFFAKDDGDNWLPPAQPSLFLLDD